MINYIQERTPYTELLALLAEECADVLSGFFKKLRKANEDLTNL